jgi:hypothetical protein
MSEPIKINGLQQQRLNSFVLFPNLRKENDNHPDYKGAMNCDGADWEISAWTKKTSKGGEMITGMVRTPWVKGSSPAFPSHPVAKTAPVQSVQDEEDDIPF